MILHRSSSRSGLSLVEIIVVLGLLLFLVGALMSFFFSIRRVAGREQSLNNLKQIALATHSYNDTFKTMPPTVGRARQGNRQGTILYHLLPFIEQQPLYNLGPAWEAGTIGMPVAVYLDPRDSSAPPGNKFDAWLATCNYAANWLAIKNGEKGIGNGFPDGTSVTILFTERYQMCNQDPCAWAYDRLHYWAPMVGYYSVAKFQRAPKQGECDPRLAQALEADGILVVWADATTRMLRYSISSRTWYLVLHPSDGNAIPAEFGD